ncbi:Ribonuclease HII [Achromobacter sp. 2789STDY5608633]|jgi:ribonuclease HII|uniref:hypothetical protein n=1 Tax=Achromobacter sp. 2789STDY5608633 TaxID=1806501 RepID=UPI0006C375E1|nr:hypothetical protein [Achromobacter sp. 2789STDY5608633]CUJ69912.1 Ribonuclease HII [Achromobacter sp. 2789STDY5608633]
MEPSELFVAPAQHVLLTAGVDKPGRGLLTGEDYAAPVTLDPSRFVDGLGDSEVLTEIRREQIALQIKGAAARVVHRALVAPHTYGSVPLSLVG